MFLHSKYLNEGSSTALTAKVDKNQLHEGSNPKNRSMPGSSLKHWPVEKRDSLVNERWEKLRNSI
jgi:hypothetical protein